MALDPDPQRQGEVERLFVRQAQLVGELVNADLLRQGSSVSFGVSDVPSRRQSVLLSSHIVSAADLPDERIDCPGREIGAQRPLQRAAAGGTLEAGS